MRTRHRWAAIGFLVLRVLCPPALAGGAETARTAFDLLERAENARVSGRLDDAEALLRQALATARTLGPATLLEARALDGLADLEREAGRLESAIESYRKAVPLFARNLGPGQPRLAVSLHNLGVTLIAAGRVEEAREPLRRALEIWIAVYGGDSDQAANTRRALQRAGAGD